MFVLAGINVDEHRRLTVCYVALQFARWHFNACTVGLVQYNDSSVYFFTVC